MVASNNHLSLVISNVRNKKHTLTPEHQPTKRFKPFLQTTILREENESILQKPNTSHSETENSVADEHQYAADDFDQLHIPIGGDQLTRVRLDGAKALRMGAHTVEERFYNLYPILIEMFHTHMDFLEKTVKKFMKEGTGRDQGTLRNLQIMTQRTSVNGNIKLRFHAHDEFVEFCGDAYFLEAAMEHFGMPDLQNPPTRHKPAENITGCHRQKRMDEFDEVMNGFLSTIEGPLNFDEHLKKKS